MIIKLQQKTATEVVLKAYSPQGERVPVDINRSSVGMHQKEILTWPHWPAHSWSNYSSSISLCGWEGPCWPSPRVEPEVALSPPLWSNVPFHLYRRQTHIPESRSLPYGRTIHVPWWQGRIFRLNLQIAPLCTRRLCKRKTRSNHLENTCELTVAARGATASLNWIPSMWKIQNKLTI